MYFSEIQNQNFEYKIVIKNKAIYVNASKGPIFNQTFLFIIGIFQFQLFSNAIPTDAIKLWSFFLLPCTEHLASHLDTEFPSHWIYLITVALVGNAAAVEPYNNFKDSNILFHEASENPGKIETVVSTLQMTKAEVVHCSIKTNQWVQAGTTPDLSDLNPTPPLPTSLPGKQQ